MIERLLQAERLLLHGMVDQAEEIYRDAIEHDPNNAIAVVGLARVALEHRDDHLAYERARQALSIDPQNVAALRLEARLSEVLTARGESVQRPRDVVAAPPPRTGASTPADVGPPGNAPAAPGGTPTPPVDAQAAPSEQAALARNRSMAEARQLDERRAAQKGAAQKGAAQKGAAQRGAAQNQRDKPGSAGNQPAQARPGLLRRLLGQ